MEHSLNTEKRPIFFKAAGLIGVIALIASFAGLAFDSKHTLYSILHGGLFWISVGLGALGFTMIHHVVGARWSIVFRRHMENMSVAMIPLAALLAATLILGLKEIFIWADAAHVLHDELLQKKQAYLNPGFFALRAFIYVGCWALIAGTLRKKSLQSDQAHQVADNEGLVAFSAPMILLYAITVTFAAFDWMMSLDPHWYSTIFGVYFFSGALVAFFASLILLSLLLRFFGILDRVITVEHYHDLGKLLFAFTCFWAFIAFSQYMLIWYGNIPEETIWYKHRWEGSWKYMSLFLAGGHFVFPFLALIPRASKRNVLVLGLMAVWMLVMHWVDLYWLIFPNLDHHGVHFSWTDLTASVGFGAVFVAAFWNLAKKHDLLPSKDPFLEQSIHHINH
ncbi:MAG: hypothetical protein KDD52_08445 [Bdellovibrionales bacterium]|nr:hypothetical protein [Bdellovibrionales bacterium]